MINKKKEDYLFTDGEGRPHMLERKPPLKNDAERNRAEVINLDELNEEGKAPVNFHRKAGRVIGTFTEMMKKGGECEDSEDAYDIE